MHVERARLKYRPEIDGLRAVAVVAVIVNHLDKALLPGGYLGVDIFFVISGYVISSSLAENTSGTIGQFLLDFYSRRIKRLLPALITTVAAASLCGAIFINPKTQAFMSSMRAGVYALAGLSNMFFFREKVDYFAPSTELNLFTHTWSLGVEEQFYVVFPLLYWLGRGPNSSARQPSWIFASLLGSMILASWTGFVWLKNAVPGSYFLMPLRFWELGIGCATFIWGQRLLALAPGLGAAAAMTGVVALLATLVSPPDWEVPATTAAAVGTAILILTLRPGLWWHRALSSQPIVAVGLMSYSLYLWHWCLFVIGRWTIGITPTTAPLVLALVAAVSAATYAYIERPLRYASWARTKSTTVVYGVVASSAVAAMVLLASHQLRGVLYVGEPARLSQAGVPSLSTDRRVGDRVIWPARDCVLVSDSDVGRPISRDRCTIASNGGSRRQFLVIGNSFSAAEFEMYSVLAEKDLGSVTATSSWGASPIPELQNNSPWSQANQYYWNTVIPSLIGNLKAGDVLVIINEIEHLTPRHPGSDDQKNLALLETGLSRLAAELGSKGVSVIFQSINSFMRDSNCTPDMAKQQWFNFGENRTCTVLTRVESIARRKPLEEALARVHQAHSNFHVLDLLPLFCGRESCRMVNDEGIFLYRDEYAHPSAEANMLARDYLLSAVNEAIATPSLAKGGAAAIP